MNNKLIYVVAIVAIVLVVSASFIYINNSKSTSQSKTSTSISIVDDEGYQTILTSIPTRIVSLAPSCTEIAFDIGVGDKVVGVTSVDDAPYNFSAWIAAGNITNTGEYGSPNMETIASLHPGLILTDDLNDANLPTLRSMGYNVIVLNPTNIAGICQDISIVGRATGAENNATALIKTINNEVTSVQTKIDAANLTKPTVYYEVWYDPSYLMSAGAGSFINDAISKAGGINIFGNLTSAYPSTSSETIVQLNPEVIILPSGSSGMAAEYGSVAQVEARPGWSTISAVQNNRVYVLNQDLFSRPGPRIGELVQAIATALYPQLFNSTS